jgi:putative phosphoesterase
MKLGLISDIHGNYEALKVVLAELERMDVDEVFCLGDVVGYYPQINECCEALRKRGIKSLMGNHDWYLSGGGFCPRSKSVNDCLVYQRAIIRADNLEWVRGFMTHARFGRLSLVHGGWSDPIDEYLTHPSEEYFDRVEGDFFSSGHTHIQSLHTWHRKTYCNPGSVGQPRDNDPRAAFAIFDDQFHLFRVEYDMQPVFDLMDSLGFGDYYYGGLKTGARNLCRLPT